MLDRGYDQADGLRRMFSTDRPRLIEIVAGRAGVGRTLVAVNLGIALARSGRHTLLVDCTDRAGESRALRYLSLRGSATGAAGAHDPIALPGWNGFAVLPLRLSDSERVNGAARAAATNILAQASGLDCVLVSSAVADSLLLPTEQRRDVLVVLSRAASSITDAYALIKRMSLHGAHCRFQVVVNRASSDSEAHRIFQNMARVAQGYLDVQLELLGFIPADPALERAAAQGRSVIDADPASPASAAFRRLAERIVRARSLSPASNQTLFDASFAPA